MTEIKRGRDITSSRPPRSAYRRASQYVPINRTAASQQLPQSMPHRPGKRNFDFRNFRSYLNCQQLQRYWRWINRGYRERSISLTLVAVVVAGVVIPVVSYIQSQQRYILTAATKKLVGNTAPGLVPKITYDSTNQLYQFNKDGITVENGSSNPLAKLQAQAGGSGAKDKQLYSVDLPQDMSKGITYYDNQEQLSFTLVPQFKAAAGKLQDDKLVYPINGMPAQAIYTVKNNGLKEDLVFSKSPGETVSMSYKLELPKTLEAKAIDGTGEIGIYSADPSLFGNISYGTAQDQAAVMKAREKADKNYLVFALPPPVIKGGQQGSDVTSRFSLSGDTLTVIAEGLNEVSYPMSLDPSVVVTSSSDFATNGNDDSNIDFPSNQINRGALTGGGLSGGFTSNGSSGFTAVDANTAVAYNGYLYSVGGYSSGGNTNIVQYALLCTGSNSGTGGCGATAGSIGTWATNATTFNNVRNNVGAVAYNGYLYVYGGENGSTVYGDVQYAPINSNGSIGSFTTSANNMNSLRTGFGSAVYNGYLYAAGGCGSTPSSCGTLYNTTEYAPINGDGSVGAWTVSGNNFTTARNGTRSVVYNGYLYIMGGSGGSSLNDVQYTPINADGSIGTWHGTTSFTTARMNFATYAYNGYMYISCGGYGVMADTQYAPINANGTVGNWFTGASVGTARVSLGGTAYNGYVYVIGGDTSGGNAVTTNVSYAKIDVAGVASPRTAATGTAFATLRLGAATVAYGGYIYVMGGDSSGSTPVTTVSAATLSSNGTVGNYSTTGMTVLPSVNGFFGATAYNGYMFIAGGCKSAWASCTTATNDLNNVYSAPITPGTGAIGTWTAQNAIGTAVYGLSLVAYNGYLYSLGGINTSTFKTATNIQYHAIGASGAVSGTWSNSAQSIAVARAYFGATVYGGVLYIAGGCSAGATSCTTARQDILYQTLGTGGDLTGAFNTNGVNLPNTRGLFGFGIANGYAYITGGRSNTTYYNDVQYAQVSTSGSIGSWTSSSGSTLSTNRYGFGYAMYNGFMYIAGGYSSTTYYNDTQYFQLNNGGTGSTASWATNANSFTTTRNGPGSVAVNGYIYVIGGDNLAGTTYSDVQYAAINNDGTVGTWASAGTGANIGTGTTNMGVVTNNGYIYILGGATSNTTAVTTVQYALICTGSNSGSGGCTSTAGTLGTWTTNTNSLNTTRADPGAAVNNGYIYVVGGCTSSPSACGGWSNSVERALICTGSNSGVGGCSSTVGSVGTWTTDASTFTNGRMNPGTIIVNGYLYVLGGYYYSGGNVWNNDVQYALICTGSNSGVGGCSSTAGSLGTWNFTTSFNGTRTAPSIVANNGFMYVIGGQNSGYLSDVQVAPINANGTLGNWMATASMSAAREGAGTVTYNGYVYILGGTSAVNTPNNTVFYSSFLNIPRIGNYSKLFDLGTSNAVLTGISYNGTVPNGLGNIDYRLASSSGSFGSLQNANSIPAVTSTCTGSTSRYAWVTVTLDDSASNAVFPDSLGANNANLTDFTLTYSTGGHPAPAQRLRAGQTLQQGGLSPLDTCIDPTSDPTLTQNLAGQFDFTGNVNDTSGAGNNGTTHGGMSATTDRKGASNAAYAFNGSSGFVSTNNSINNPQTFSLNIWFKTTTTSGGVLIGFANSQTSTTPGSFDRMLWMNSSGQLAFGLYDGNVEIITTSGSYNDGNWHMATAEQSSSGMSIYVDAVQAASGGPIVAQNYSGWWRIGNDHVSAGWDGTPSDYINATLDDVKIYTVVLSQLQISELYVQ